jgi:hypothetical protein
MARGDCSTDGCARPHPTAPAYSAAGRSSHLPWPLPQAPAGIGHGALYDIR